MQNMEECTRNWELFDKIYEGTKTTTKFVNAQDYMKAHSINKY